MKSQKRLSAIVAAAAIASTTFGFAAPANAGPLMCTMSKMHANNWRSIFMSLPRVYDSFAWVEFGRAETLSNRLCQ